MIHYKEYNWQFFNSAEDIFCLDTETSSFWINDLGKPQAYDPDLSDDWYNTHECGALVYIWMLSFNDTVVYGRDIAELPSVLRKLDEHCEGMPIIYVHNLAYDFQFLRNVIEFTDVFARTRRKPMKAIGCNCEFRCSYMLTRLSLDSWSKSLDLQYRKQTGLLEYTVLRTPYTELTEGELKYCEYDLLSMYAGLKKYLKKYAEMKKIPITQTGEVRNVVKDMFKGNNTHLWKMTRLQPASVNEYRRLRSVFAGGETHANRKYVSGQKYVKKLKKNVEIEKILKRVASFDKTSDYPYQMCSEKYPLSRFVKTSNDLRFMKPDTYAYIIELVITDIKAKYNSTYISRSHCCSVKNGRYDNGRLISADRVSFCITELDYQTIKEMYEFNVETVVAVYRSRKQYLPKCYIEYILELYKYKTSLKGNASQLDLYMQSKQFINSLFGMMVTDILMSDVIYDHNDGWAPPHMLTEKELQDKLDDIQKKFYRNTMAYQLGVWVTAYARRELMRAVIYCDEHEIYHDTDSVKLLHYEKYLDYFTAENKIMDDKLRKMCEFYDIDFELTRPEKPNGKRAPLGYWDFEGIYAKFKTLGAKKYAYWYMFNADGLTIDPDHYGMHCTVSGVPPKQGSRLLKDLHDFRTGFRFDRERCGKKLLTYIDGCNPETVFKDGYILNYKHAVNIRNNSYTIGQTDEYINTIMEINDMKGFL